MKRTLVRMLLLVVALSVASLAMADPWTDSGMCYIQCSNGTTYGPYGSTAPDCCRDFDNLCGGSGLAYLVVGMRPNQQIYDCFVY